MAVCEIAVLSNVLFTMGLQRVQGTLVQKASKGRFIAVDGVNRNRKTVTGKIPTECRAEQGIRRKG